MSLSDYTYTLKAGRRNQTTAREWVACRGGGVGTERNAQVGINLDGRNMPASMRTQEKSSRSPGGIWRSWEKAAVDDLDLEESPHSQDSPSIGTQ